MPPNPVIADVWRVTFDFNTVGGVSPRNVVHVHDTAGTSTPLDIANGVQTAVVDEMWAVVNSSFEVLTLTVRKLDGVSGSHTFATDHTIKWFGHAGGQPLPNVAAKIKFKTGLGGRSHRGGVYLGPIGENEVDAGILDSGDIATVVAAWESFRATASTDHIPLQVASYRHATASPVVSVAGRTRSSSMARRLDQIPYG
jgi:hypothetical protein